MAGQPQDVAEQNLGEVGSDTVSNQALDELFTRLYEKIKRLAARVCWSSSSPTLNPTALVHEAYMKLRKHPPDFDSLNHEEVIAVFAHAMHQILIDAARRKSAQKRSGAGLPEPVNTPIEDVVAIGVALEQLERDHPEQARVVQCRFLLGMTVDETSAALKLSKRTVERNWQCAKTTLLCELDGPGE